MKTYALIFHFVAAFAFIAVFPASDAPAFAQNRSLPIAETCETFESPSPSLLEVVRKESSEMETFPLSVLGDNPGASLLSLRYNVRWDLTYERFLPFYRVVAAASSCPYSEVVDCIDVLPTLNAREQTIAALAFTVYLARVCSADGEAFPLFDLRRADVVEELKPSELEIIINALESLSDAYEIPFDEVDGDKASWEKAFRADFLRWQYALGKRNPFFLSSFMWRDFYSTPRFQLESFVERMPVEVLFTMAIAETDPKTLTQKSPYVESFGVFPIEIVSGYERRKNGEKIGSTIVFRDRESRDFSSAQSSEEADEKLDLMLSDEELFEEAKAYRAYLFTLFATLRCFHNDDVYSLLSSAGIKRSDVASVFKIVNESRAQKFKSVGDWVDEMFRILLAAKAAPGATSLQFQREQAEALQSHRFAARKLGVDPSTIPLAQRASDSKLPLVEDESKRVVGSCESQVALTRCVVDRAEAHMKKRREERKRGPRVVIGPYSDLLDIPRIESTVK